VLVLTRLCAAIFRLHCYELWFCCIYQGLVADHRLAAQHSRCTAYPIRSLAYSHFASSVNFSLVLQGMFSILSFKCELLCTLLKIM
jgi:hypothetical protein